MKLLEDKLNTPVSLQNILPGSRGPLDAIISKHFVEKTMQMDGHRFLDCTFRNCRLIYSGGNAAWERAAFSNCQLQFRGAAKRTLEYLRYFGFELPSPTVVGGARAPQNAAVNK